MSGLSQAEHSKTSATTRQSSSSKRSKIENHPDRRDMIYAEKDSIISDVINNPKSLEKVLHDITKAPSEQDVMDLLMKLESAFDTYYSQANVLAIGDDYSKLPESLHFLARHIHSCIHDKDSGSEVLICLWLRQEVQIPKRSRALSRCSTLFWNWLVNAWCRPSVTTLVLQRAMQERRQPFQAQNFDPNEPWIS
jgi:hypothetical protein